MRVCAKTRPVRAPGLQAAGFSAQSCRPRALTQPVAGVFKHALRVLSKLTRPAPALLRTAAGRCACHRRASWPPSLNFGR